MEQKMITKKEILKAFEELKLRNEELLLVYGQLQKDQYWVGGAQAVLEALYEAAGFNTTIVMPAHELNQPCPTFFDKQLAPDLLAMVKDYTPAFNLERSPIISGELAQVFGLNKRVVRSNHPLASFLSLGRKANWLMENHQLDSMFGEGSPLQKLYAQGAKILCLDSNYESITAFHYLAYVVKEREKKLYEAVIQKKGQPTLIEFEDLALDSKTFNEIGARYEIERHLVKTIIGTKECSLIDYRDFIEFGVNYIRK